MYIGVKAVEPLENYRLALTFENDERGIFDMTPYLNTGVFQELRDARVFQSAHVAFDSVEWNNGADICPEMLYAQSEKTLAPTHNLLKSSDSNEECLHSGNGRRSNVSDAPTAGG